MSLIIAFLLILPPFTITQTETKRIKLTEDLKEVKQSVLELIPVGSRIEKAKEVMEQNGFKCVLREKATFVEYDKKRKQILHEGEDFLWCDKSERVAEFVLRRWQVIITHKDEIVSGVYTSTGLIAP